MRSIGTHHSTAYTFFLFTLKAISSNLLIDSGKKICDKDQQPKRRGAMKVLEAKEKEMLPPNAEQHEIPNKRRCGQQYSLMHLHIMNK